MNGPTAVMLSGLRRGGPMRESRVIVLHRNWRGKPVYLVPGPGGAWQLAPPWIAGVSIV